MNHKYQLRKFLLTTLSKDLFAYQFKKPMNEMPYAYSFSAFAGFNATDGCQGAEGIKISSNRDGVKFSLEFGCSFRPRYKALHLTKIELYKQIQEIVNTKTTEDYCQKFMQNKTIYPSIL